MRVTKIEVTKLFGVFDHVIPLRLSDRITIIHGPNGYGKTAILTMVQSLLKNHFGRLRKISFERFTVELDDGRTISVTKTIIAKDADKDKEAQIPILRFELLAPSGKKIDEHTHASYSEFRDSAFPVELVDRHIPDLERIGPNTWTHTSTGRRLDLDDIVDQYGHMLPIGRSKARKPTPEWLAEISKSFDIRLIEAQRLLSVPDAKRIRRPDLPVGYEPSVHSYSKELSAIIQEIQARYGTSSQQLDSTFPTRVIQPRVDAPLSDEALQRKLTDLEQNRQRIIAAGLLTAEHNYTPIFDPKQTIDAATKSVLSLYSSDVEKKLSVFSEITEKIELFKELVNKRFAYKQIDIEAERGFRLQSSTGGTLVPSDLSSGEQHELVLLYELLFKTKPNALILIDEPELSLHVAWQVEFLKDLARVIKLSSFDVILATHSPQIINDRWDLAIELKGP